MKHVDRPTKTDSFRDAAIPSHKKEHTLQMTPDFHDSDRICRARVKQLFEYLKALNDHRNPAIRQVSDQRWTLWMDELPAHPDIEFNRINPVSLADDAESQSSVPLLRVKRPSTTHAPAVPKELTKWLQPGFENPSSKPVWLERLEADKSESAPRFVHFSDVPELAASRDAWLKQWETWSETERPARSTLQVFEKLYELYLELQREGERYELVIADGLLSWDQPEGAIYHPLIFQRVQLQFDTAIPEFSIVDTDSPSELYATLFSENPRLDPEQLRASRNEFEASGLHTLGEDAASFLQTFAHTLSPHGLYKGEGRPPKGSKNPQIGLAPIVLLRDRSKGFGAAIERVLEGLSDRIDFPEAIRNIVGCSRSKSDSEAVGDAASPQLSETDILFGKPANPEQRRIANAIDQHSAVLVQGPPGTGKSHTIANLIGHLLAQGQSVLVTSHTTKALRVLRNHLVKSLQPLCVSVLDNDIDGKNQLEEAVNAISARLSDSDASTLRREAKQLANERQRILDDLAKTRYDLRDARYGEYRELSVGGEAISPLDAAKIVASGRGKNDWIPTPVSPGEPCPLGPAEVIELYETNAVATDADDRYVASPLPDLTKIPLPAKISSVFAKICESSDSGRFNGTLWRAISVTDDKFPSWIASLRTVIAEFETAIKEFRTFNNWQLEAVNAGRSQTDADCVWKHLIAKIVEVSQVSDASTLGLIKYQPQLNDKLPVNVQCELSAKICDHIQQHGKLSLSTRLFKPQWRRAIAGWRTLGRTPASQEEFSAIANLAEFEKSKCELSILWDGLVGCNGGPAFRELGKQPEQSARQLEQSIRGARQWWRTKWQSLEESLRSIGFDFAKWHESSPQTPNLNFERHSELRQTILNVEERLIPTLRAAADGFEGLLLKAKIDHLERQLSGYSRPEVDSLREALRIRQPEQYLHAYSELVAASARHKIASRRKQLLDRLDQSCSSGQSWAPMWASAIRRRDEPHGSSIPPGDVNLAWEWRQFSDELNRRAEADLEQLGARIEGLEKRLHEVTNQLIDRLAWASQLEHVTISQQQALVGWLGIIKRIGRGFTKRAPALRLAAQKQMQECKAAVPVWIMPLARVAENFDLGQPRFDVVIIDEASQCDPMALLAIMAARRVVVVGDDKQVSPLAVGQNLDVVQSLIRQHLDGIPSAILYTGERSIYEVAMESFQAPICLLEHFRCVPDIIDFSNFLSYSGRIKPLREPSSTALSPVVAHRIRATTDSSNKVNREEAVEVASLIVAATEHPAYCEQTFGVISLVGEEQARVIETILRRRLSPDEFQRRRIVCGSPAQFQGDERDVMFLSMIDTPRDNPLPLKQTSQFEQRFNVAASRARNQMWVVYSLDPGSDLKPGDLRRRLIEHAIDPKAVSRTIENLATQTDSPFEREVLELLVHAGYRVIPQWPVGRYRIDMVVEGDNKRLAVECDGDRYHTLENLASDMERQAILERLGWRFVRIRGSVFYRDKEEAMKPVFAKLKHMSIPPASANAANAANSPQADAVTEVRRKAAALRAEWRRDEESSEHEEI